MKTVRVLLSVLLLVILATASLGEEAAMEQIYQSDFTAGEDGWYPRSMGTAQLAAAPEGAMLITGRENDWNSPGRDFEMIPGLRYSFSVEVKQDEVDTASFMISIAHSAGGQESYENLGRGQAARGEWVTVNGAWMASTFDRYVLYVETTGAPTLSFAFRNFTVLQEKADFEQEEIPSLSQLYQDYFDFGTAVTRFEAQNKARMDFYASQFNLMTPGNEMKPDSLIDVRASRELAKEDQTQVAVKFDDVTPLLNYARDNGIKLHGHVFVWHSQTPEAFFHENYDPAKPLVSREIMLSRLEHFMAKTFAYVEENYPGLFVSWDIVNEAIDDSTGKLRSSNWLKVVGEDYLLRAFELARRVAPEGLKLYYNDYNTAVPKKQDGIVKLLKELVAEGNIDGYGFQMHHDIAYPTVSSIRASVERVAQLGLKLRVSELDITIPNNTEAQLAKQAEEYGAILRLLLPYSGQLEAVQVWGVSDNLSWRASGYPLLFDGSQQPKPAFWAVVDALEDKAP